MCDLGSAKYKQTQNKDSIITLVKSSLNILNKYKVGLKSLSINNSAASSYKKSKLNYSRWAKDETRKYNSSFAPKIIGESTKNHFIIKISYTLKIELKLQGNSRFLNTLRVNTNYFKTFLDC